VCRRSRRREGIVEIPPRAADLGTFAQFRISERACNATLFDRRFEFPSSDGINDSLIRFIEFKQVSWKTRSEFALGEIVKRSRSRARNAHRDY